MDNLATQRKHRLCESTYFPQFPFERYFSYTLRSGEQKRLRKPTQGSLEGYTLVHEGV
jgi:hypothetical protein